MRGAITKRTVDALPAPPQGEIILWDDRLAGFGLRVRATGTKSYLILYRAGSGRGAPLRKVVIGKHGTWTPESARTEAKRLLGGVAGGGDPARAKAEQRKALTLAELADRFLVEHVDTKRKPRTGAEYRRLLQKIILPALGKKKVIDVVRADIARLHHAGRSTPYQANRVLAVLSKLFNLAEAWGIRPDSTNPCRHVEKNREKGRERFISNLELAQLGNALSCYDGSLYAAAAVKLLLFSGARLGEILGLQWHQIDFERGEARLADSKTGAKTLHLPPPALAVLSALPRIAANPHVIVGQKEGAALVNLEKPWRAIRQVACLPDVRLHDLRHAFASVGAMSGDSLLMIGKLLGHTQAATTQRYAHLTSDPVKAAAAGIASKIAAALDHSERETKPPR